MKVQKTLAVAAMLVAIVACGSSDEETTAATGPVDNTEATEATETPEGTPAQPAVEATPSAGGDSNFGTLALAAGGEAITGAGTSGGNIDATTLSGECAGNVSSTPDHLLNITSPVPAASIYAQAEQDITLVIQRPDGTYWCDDDSDGTNPALSGELVAGTYKVWIGSYNAEENASYRIGASAAADVMPSILAN